MAIILIVVEQNFIENYRNGAVIGFDVALLATYIEREERNFSMIKFEVVAGHPENRAESPVFQQEGITEKLLILIIN